MVGIVASPTPTVPISSDSSSVMSSELPNWLASAVAVIQPAVPPPRMTTERTRRAPAALGEIASLGAVIGASRMVRSPD